MLKALHVRIKTWLKIIYLKLIFGLRKPKRLLVSWIEKIYRTIFLVGIALLLLLVFYFGPKPLLSADSAVQFSRQQAR